MTTHRAVLWALAGVLLLTFWLGVRGLNADIVWRDEYHSLEDAGIDYLGPFTPLGVWRQVADRNPWHAPGYFILLNLWGRAVGSDPAALRAMSLLLGVLTVALTFRVGRQAAGVRVGVYAALLLGTSAFLAHFLHEMRVYALMAFLSVATVSLYWQIVKSRREPHWALWLAFLACAAGLFYSHYFAAIPLAVLGLYHLLFVPRRRRWWVMLGMMVLSGLLFLPWATVLARAMGLVADRVNLSSPALSPGEALAALAFQFSNGLPILMLVVFGAALFYRERGWRYLLLLAAGSTGLLLLTNAVVEVMHAGRLRYLLPLWPLLALAGAAGIVVLQRWRPLGLAVLALWAVLGVAHSLYGDLAPDLDGANYVFPFHWVVQAIDDAAQPGDVAVNYLPDVGMRASLYETIANYYFARQHIEYLILWTPDPATAETEQAVALDLLSERPRVWLATMPDRQPAGLNSLLAELEARFVNCTAPRDDSRLTVRQYARSAAACAR